MADTVKVTALKYHTLNGEEHAEGATYKVDADQVGNLVAQGLVSAPDAPAAPAKPSTPVQPLGTDDVPTGKQ